MDTKKVGVKPFIISLVSLVLIESIRAFLTHLGFKFSIFHLGGIRILELIVFVTTINLWGNGMISMGLSGPEIRPGVISGIIWSACFGGVVLLGFGALYVMGINPIKLFQGRLPEKTMDLIIYFLVGGLIAPIVEEFFFRGILYGFFRQWGVLTAIILSTFLFVLAHPGATPIQVIGGIIFALSYEKEGKLMAPIIIHITANNALFALSLLPRLGIGV